MAYWKTKDGRKLEIEWMDSVHLVNALNMMLRAGNDSKIVMKSHIFRETAKRGLVKVEHMVLSPVLTVPAHRESIIELCMLRALLDTPEGRDHYPQFIRDRTAFIESAAADPALAQVWNEFVKNRMTRT